MGVVKVKRLESNANAGRAPNLTSSGPPSRRQLLRSGLAIGAGGLLAAASGIVLAKPAAAIEQSEWRWCNKCQGLFYAGPEWNLGRCPQGGSHYATISSSYHYIMWSDLSGSPHLQGGWRFCQKCRSMAYNGHGPGWCPADGHHDHSVSYNYTMWHSTWLPGWEQNGWRWCRNCQGLAYGAAPTGWCPAWPGARHDHTGSLDYWLTFHGP
jgi:hypothetical protein